MTADQIAYHCHPESNGWRTMLGAYADQHAMIYEHAKQVVAEGFGHLQFNGFDRCTIYQGNCRQTIVWGKFDLTKQDGDNIQWIRDGALSIKVA